MLPGIRLHRRHLKPIRRPIHPPLTRVPEVITYVAVSRNSDSRSVPVVRWYRPGWVWALAALLVLTGCAHQESDLNSTYQQASDSRYGPGSLPAASPVSYVPTLTSFEPALGCMDKLFLDHGVGKLTVLVEDIPDLTSAQASRLPGAREMLIAAVAQMTRRSKAVQLAAAGATDATLAASVGLPYPMQALDSPSVYTLGGLVSRYDEAVSRRRAGLGVSLPAWLGGRTVVDAGDATDGLALDLGIIKPDRMTLAAGVSSNNSLVALRGPASIDTRPRPAAYPHGSFYGMTQLGLDFGLDVSRSEGSSQALRMLAELGAIELFGKLARLPYWTCIGVDDQNEAVREEIADWWAELSRDDVGLTAYWQHQLRHRGLYRGAVTGLADARFSEAVSNYRQSLGLVDSAAVDLELFRAYLGTDHGARRGQARAASGPSRRLGSSMPAARPAAPPPGWTAGKPDADQGKVVATKAGSGDANSAMALAPAMVLAGIEGQGAADAPKVIVASPEARGSHRSGRPYQIDVTTDRDGYLYCYLFGQAGDLTQFFPNPGRPSAAVRGATRMRFPGSLPFTFVAGKRGGTESVACFTTTVSLGSAPVGDGADLKDLADVTRRFSQLVGPGLGVGTYEVLVRP